MTRRDASQAAPALLTDRALDGTDAALLGPAAGRRPLPGRPPEPSAYFDANAGRWVPFPVNSYEAGARASEQEMGFHRFPASAGWVFLTGPSGSSPQGHRWNERGFDGVAVPLDGPFELRIPEEKSSPGVVKEATAIDKNWQINIERLRDRLSQPWFDRAPRIAEARAAVDAAARNARNGLPPPANVVREVLHFGDPAPVSRALRERGIVGRAPRALTAPPTVGGAALGVAAFLVPAVSEQLAQWRWAETGREAVARVAAEQADYRREHPDQGVLVALRCAQLKVAVPVPLPPRVRSVEIEKRFRTEREAIVGYESQARVLRADPNATDFWYFVEYHWIPPLAQESG
ncbi:hypothetical protein AB0M36_24305 [Actinoplanes sp. NPDC051346]|uniref:hypothetical protein n=1 Tax=Actinoplanes sp. NPDC051346 TaxID=3155048 RepID=UPI003435FEE1